MPASTFILVLRVLIGNPEDPATPAYDYVIDHNLTLEDCYYLRKEYEPIWLGDNHLGMFCAEE